MTVIKLRKLRLKNFKAARDVELNIDGADATVAGTNAAGKTTLKDGHDWILTGKDSLGRSDFEIKTLNAAGEPLHKLEHVAELVLDVDGDELVLRKVYKEDWVKKRGSATDTFSGHTTDYYVDGVPMQKKEFDARVAEIAPESLLRLLSDPLAFNNLHWKKRRELLLEVCGDVSDADVIASNPELEDLPEILGKRKLEDHQKVIEARRREINDTLKVLPARVDEVTQGLPELPEASQKQLEAELAKLKEQRTGIQEERVRVQAGGEVAEKRRRLSEIQGELKDVENRARGAIDSKVQEARRKLGAIEDRHDVKVREVRRLETELEDAEARVATLAKRRDSLREEWRAINSRTFEHAHDDENCPVCGQALPAEQIQEAHAKALEEFNARQAKALEENKAAGMAAKEESDRLESRTVDLRTAIAEGRDEIEKLALESRKASEEVERLQRALPDLAKNNEYKRLLDEQQSVQAAIEQLQAGNTEALAEIDARLAQVDEQITGVQESLAVFERRKTGEARITELEAQEEQLAGELEDIQRQVYLCETFIRTKVDMLTDRINSKFELAEFKLFDVQINEGINPTCETVHKGVPYSSLNHGARIQVGLDIIRTLQAHYGLFPPVWVDNAESVVRLPDMDCQVIRLVVSEADKKLRVETAPKREEVAA